MQFLVTGYDGTDEKALDRRLAVREDHVERNDKLRDAGHLLYAVANPRSGRQNDRILHDL